MHLRELKSRHISAIDNAAGSSLGVDCSFALHSVRRRSAAHGLTQGLVSVVLPVYNQVAFLKKALDSVLAQTYNYIELILVNDGSSDKVLNVLSQYQQTPTFRIIHQPHLGLPRALNAGFEVASGEFWNWTSADNLMEPRMLEILVRKLLNEPTAGMVFANYRVIDEYDRIFTNPAWRPQNRPEPQSGEIRLPGNTATLNVFPDNFIGPCFLYWGWIGKTVGSYREPMGLEDYDYWLRLQKISDIIHLGTSDILYNYRVHSNTLSAKLTSASSPLKSALFPEPSMHTPLHTSPTD